MIYSNDDGNWDYRKKIVVLDEEQVRQINENRRFYQKLTRKPLCTYILLGLCVAFWIFSYFIGSEKDEQGLLELGAKFNLFIDFGQTWRLVSPIFLHFGVMHMIFNGYALFVLGRMVENLYGSRRFLVLFMLSGIAGVAGSYVGSDQMSVGASGAIFGLLGAAVLVGYKHKEEIPPAFRKFFGRGMMPWVFLNLGMGLMIPGIDNWAHVSGLIAGVAAAALMHPPISVTARENPLHQIPLNVVTLMMAAVVVWAIFHMIANVVNGGRLPLPSEEEWVAYRDDFAMLAAEVPEEMEKVANSELTYGAQFVLKSFGFWVAVEREPDKIITREELLDDLRAEIAAIDEIDQRSVEIDSFEPATLSGLDALKVNIRYRLKTYPDLIVTDYWMLPTGRGLVSATCSAQESIYPFFEDWCRAFVDSVVYTGTSI